MADNVNITAGTGTAVATDQLAGGEHVQKVKLLDGTADSSAVIPGDATNGLDVDVTRLPALVAGSANIGDVDVASIAAGDNNIGNVDIVSVPAPLSSTGAGTEAAALRVTVATDSTGVLSVDDNGGALTVDGTVTANLSATDNAVLDAIQAAVETLDNAISGSEMQVDVVGALPAGANAIGKLAANSGVDIGDVDITSVTPGTAAANLGKAEDAAHSSGDVGVMALGIRDDTLGAFSGAENDYEPFHMTAAGRLYVSATVDAALPAGDNNVGNVDIVTVPADPFGANADAASATGSISAKLRHLAATGIAGMTALPTGSNAIGKLAANSGVDIGDVDVASIVPGTGATNLGKAEDAAHSSGDVGIQVLAIRDDTLGAFSGAENDYEPLHTDATGALWVDPQGNVAHDAADSGNPIKVGAIAKNAEQTAVANNDRVQLAADLVGKLITLPYANPENFVSGATSDITNTTATSVIAAAGAGIRNYITSILVTNSHATVGTFVNITDGSGGTILWTGYAAPAGGGFSVTLPTPIKTTANTALYCACATTGSNTRVCAAGYKGV